MQTYINGKYQGETETIDEFETRKEARRMIAEYRLAYQGSGFELWLSRRPCNAWRDAS